MWYIFCKAVITVLVIYAIVDIAGKFFSAIFSPEPCTNRDILVVIRVKNQEKNLEHIVRRVIWNNLMITHGGYVPNILIVDSGSEDNTRIISEMLCEQFSFIFYTTAEQYELMRSTFDK